MNLLPATMIGHLDPDLDKPFDNPLNGPFDIFALMVEAKKHIEEVVLLDPPLT